jgi:DNA-directed RNA polymerase specialized sigma24 family protein
VVGSAANFDVQNAERLAQAALSGPSAAFMHLVNAIWPEMMSLLATGRRLRALAPNEDDRREIAVCVVEKLSRNDLHGLRSYTGWRQRHPDKTFHDWLRIVLANTARDYQRGRRSKPQDAELLSSPVRVLNEFTLTLPLDQQGTRPPVTAAQTARQLLEFAEQRLPVEQYQALTAWLKGESFEEIASGLALADAAPARKAVRAAVASLRREFSES